MDLKAEVDMRWWVESFLVLKVLKPELVDVGQIERECESSIQLKSGRYCNLYSTQHNTQ